MSNKTFRNVIRLIHLAIAACMAIFIYSPLRLDSAFATAVQIVVVPLVAITGMVMWQQPRVLKFLNGGKTQSTQRSS